MDHKSYWTIFIVDLIDSPSFHKELVTYGSERAYPVCLFGTYPAEKSVGRHRNGPASYRFDL